MIERVTEPAAIGVLEQGLKAAELRHRVISNNIANVNTPGFKKSEVAFESLLAARLNPKEDKRLAMVRTHDAHFPKDTEEETLKPRINLVEDTNMRVDKNNVDIDEEMATLAKNNIYYNVSARQLSDYYNKLKTAISGQ
jgi:flagellar basal-body rod protein FlgB